MKNSKVYQGLTPIEEHIKQLNALHGVDPHAHLLIGNDHLITDDTPPPERTQCIEIQRLKREAGLIK